MNASTLFLAGIAATTLFAFRPDTANPRLSLQISTASTEVHSGDEIKLNLTLTNTSASEIRLEETSRFCDYQVDVRDGNGTPAPETTWMSTLHRSDCGQGPTGRDITVILSPKQSYEDEIALNEFAGVKKPGQYSIQLTRTSNRNPAGLVRSNTLHVKVIQ